MILLTFEAEGRANTRGLRRSSRGSMPPFWSRSFGYTSNQGKDYLKTTHVACGHLFNYQTHHRGQVHLMLSQTSAGPPALDFYRIVNP